MRERERWRERERERRAGVTVRGLLMRLHRLLAVMVKCAAAKEVVRQWINN